MDTQKTGGARPLTNQFVQNILLERQLWIRRLLDPRRDIDFECGHPATITSADYKNLFLRGDLATRVVSVWPEESWTDRPTVFETEDETETEFEKAWVQLEKQFHIYSVLLRADILSGIGRFGIVLLGIDDGLPLNQPVASINEKGEKVGDAAHKLLYLRPFDEALVTINSFEQDTANPRYGHPKAYTIQFEEPGNIGAGTIFRSDVHWSRIIHLADNRTSSEVYGLPRMEKVFNRLLDIKKIAGGSGEMFWKGGFPGLSVEAQPGTDETLEFDTAATKDQIEAYMNGLQRYLALIGMQAKSLTPQVADPAPHLEAQIRLIAMALGVPWRVLMGSEAAQLASEQDTRSWNRRLTRRRTEYIDPYILRPLIDRLIAFGVLPEPAEVQVDWPDLNSPSDKDKADVADKRTGALAKYVQGGCDILVPPFQFLTLFLGMQDDEARAAIDEVGDRLIETDPEAELKAAEAAAKAAAAARPAPAAPRGGGRNGQVRR